MVRTMIYVIFMISVTALSCNYSTLTRLHNKTIPLLYHHNSPQNHINHGSDRRFIQNAYFSP